jgi:hypothetical protein
MKTKLLALGLGLFLMMGMGAQTLQEVIQISPSTLVLGQEQGGHVYVHAAISISEVNTATVTLGGVEPYACVADDCGDLVAMFHETEIEALVTPAPESGYAVLEFSLVTVNGEEWGGVDQVKVIDFPNPNED